MEVISKLWIFKELLIIIFGMVEQALPSLPLVEGGKTILTFLKTLSI
jgi:hypothetical protein